MSFQSPLSLCVVAYPAMQTQQLWGPLRFQWNLRSLFCGGRRFWLPQEILGEGFLGDAGASRLLDMELLVVI